MERSRLLRSFLRSFTIQGSFNERTLQAGGFSYALLPLLQRIYGGDPVGLRKATERHLARFNAHPYLAPMAVGALARLEAEGADEETIDRFRRTAAGALGAAGDRAVWGAWRPFCLLLGLLALSVGSGPWTAVLLFLAPFTAGHVAIRVWSFHRGWTRGRDAPAALASSAWKRLPRWVSRANLVLLGAAAVGLAGPIAGESVSGPAPAAVAGAVAVVASLRPEASGRIAGLLLVIGPLAAVLLR
jgi:mannose/fructose/N-acetylgalactosamine-specific phosphotransferase system component IID